METPSPSPAPPDRRCVRCGHPATTGAACSECGHPVTIGVRGPGEGPRWRTRAEWRERPLVDLAWGRRGTARFGRAHGIIAIGDRASGLVAIGTDARGLIAVGSVARGVIAFGGLAVGGISGGLAALGGLAVGWSAAGYLAKGSAAFGCYAGGGVVGARFARIGDGPVPDDLPAFVSHLDWLFASWPAAILVPLVVLSLLAAFVPLGITGLMAARGSGGRVPAATSPPPTD